MAIGWSDIKHALDEIIVHEDGNKFQRLAISLAKQRWLEIVATEVKRDGGEDAITHPYLTKDGKMFDVACSVTATLAKVKADVQRIKSRGVKLDLLIFYTPRTVLNTTVDNWKKEIKDEFTCELLVISREDLIHELLKPENQWLCSVFLNIYVPSDPSLNDVVSKVTIAVSKTLEQWKRDARFNPNHLINLCTVKIDDQHRPSGEIYDHVKICASLAESKRIILFGSPGAGKTTTIIQIADYLLHQKQCIIPLLISIPEWSDSRSDILTFITQSPNFIAAAVTSGDLALLHQAGRLAFLFNGWNEIPQALITSAGHQIRRIDREYGAAGMLVATRHYPVSPPLLEALSLRLTLISDSQRRAYVNAKLLDRSDELLNQIEGDAALSEITRTPLLLSEITNTFVPGSQLPKTKIGLFRHIVKQVEASTDHSIQLQSEPVSGRSDRYLCEIAAVMTSDGRTTLSEDKCLQVITTTNENLKSKGQLTVLPNPKSILDALCGHHLLEKSDYSVSSIHFIHQQFQEYFAAVKLKSELTVLIDIQDNEAIKRFQKDIIDMPHWEEPLKLLAEESSQLDGTLTSEINIFNVVKNLVEWTIPVDPRFAAQLARLSGPAVWNAVKGHLVLLLRKWYDLSDKAQKACALAAMVATGFDDFVDIIWPLLEHNDQQVRLQTYRTPETFFLSCLGSSWRQRVSSWEDKRREEFVGEISLKGDPTGLTTIEEFARNDPSINVRVAAMNALWWQGGIRRVHHLLIQCDDDTFKEVVRINHILDEIPPNLLSRTKEAYQSLLSDSEDVYDRLRIMLRLYKTGEDQVMEFLKAELAKNPVPDERDYREMLLKTSIESIYTVDPAWVSEWIAHRKAEGKLWGEEWSVFLSSIPEAFIDELVARLVDPNYPDQKVRPARDLIARGAGIKHAQTIFQKLIQLRQQMNLGSGQLPESERELYWRLKDIASALPCPVLVEMVLESYPDTTNVLELDLILELLGWGEFQSYEPRETISAETLDRVRLWFRSKIEFVLNQEDFSGSLKAGLAIALSRFGDIGDRFLIEQLIDADIQRIRAGKEAYRKGVRQNPQTNGSHMHWSNLYVRALCHLDPENADQTLLNLLKVPYYEEEAGKALVRLLIGNRSEETRTGRYLDYEEVYKKREEGLDDEVDHIKRNRYAAAITEKIFALKRELGRTDDPEYIAQRMKVMAAILAKLNQPDSIPLILEVLALPSRWDGWIKVEALDALVRNGAQLDFNAAKGILNPVICQLIENGLHSNNNFWLLMRCLCLLVFTDDPNRGVLEIRQLQREHLQGYQIRNVITILGQSHCHEAAKYLLELAHDIENYGDLSYNLIEALTKLRFPETRTALLSMIDPTIITPQINLRHDPSVSDIISHSIAQLSQEDPQVRHRIFQLCRQELTEPQRGLIADIIRKMDATDATLEGLYLIRDQSPYPIPYGLRKAIEHRLIEQVPLSGSSYTYTLEPRKDIEIRSGLFDMLLDDQLRRHSAFALLGYIDLLRLEHGKPSTEPRHPNFRRGQPWPLLELENKESKECAIIMRMIAIFRIARGIRG